MSKRKWTVFLCCVLVLLFAGPRPAGATEQAQNEHLSCEVELLRREEDRYVMQVMAANDGADFQGTLRLIFGNSGSEICAYDTEIVLPENGQKQFTLTIPVEDEHSVNRHTSVIFLNEKEEIERTLLLKNVFGSDTAGVPVGILSDDPGSLSYLDLGGEDFYIQGPGAPIKRIELNADNLQSYLNGLYFLVIDHYNVESLGEENLAAIEDWVKDGGWLIIGTGEYARQTLGSLAQNFLHVSVGDICEPGGDSYVSRNASLDGYYYSYRNAGINLAAMTTAELYMGQGPYYYESSENPALCASIDRGAVSIYGISLGEPELQKGDTGLHMSMLSETMYNSNSYNNFSGSQESGYLCLRAMARIDHENTDVNFNGLKILILIYVILVGPVLYLILRKWKKSEWYWIGAPLLGLVCILGVFLLGRGIRVNEAKVYSVSLQEADKTRVDTYYDAYHSGIKPWSIRLAEGYDVGGPGFRGYGSYGGGTGLVTDYHYLVRRDSGGLSLGMKPDENFESAYLYAGGQSDRRGEIVCEGFTVTSAGEDFAEDRSKRGIGGTLTNRTDRDFSLLGLRADAATLIFTDVKAGECLDIAKAIDEGRCIYDMNLIDLDSLYYDIVDYQYGPSASVSLKKDAARQDDMAALFIAFSVAEEQRIAMEHGVSLAGVSTDAQKTITGRGDEKPYLCLYDFGEMEVKEDAAD